MVFLSAAATADRANVARVFNSVGDFYGVLIARVARAARNLFSPRPWSVRSLFLSLSLSSSLCLPHSRA